MDAAALIRLQQTVLAKVQKLPLKRAFLSSSGNLARLKWSASASASGAFGDRW